jgi:hypothetical protein
VCGGTSESITQALAAFANPLLLLAVGVGVGRWSSVIL